MRGAELDDFNFLIVYICIRYVRYSKGKGIRETKRAAVSSSSCICDPTTLLVGEKLRSLFPSFEWQIDCMFKCQLNNSYVCF